MVISHKYKYLYVALPLTGSTSISNELCELYGGQRILKKHSFYHTFLKAASDEEKKYFVFSGIRNPLDTIVTQYFRLKSNHKEHFTTPRNWKRNGGWVSGSQLRKFHIVQETHADFPTFFKKFYRIPFVDWSTLAHKNFDFIIRFENLQTDFTRVLSILNIEQKHPLPLINNTAGRSKEFWTYYTPEIRPLARHIVGPFMKRWHYEFPDEWGKSTVSWGSQLEFQAVNLMKKFKWRYWG